MSKVVMAEYDAQERTLRLAEPLEGVSDHAKVQVTVTAEAPQRPWSDLRGSLSKEAADEMQQIIDETFPPNSLLE